MRPDRPLLGIRTLPVTAESQQQYGLPNLSGALVNFVNPGSAAEKAGVPLVPRSSLSTANRSRVRWLWPI